MKLVHMASGLAVAIALAACADKSADIQTPAPAANTSISATQQPAIQQPNVKVYGVQALGAASMANSHCRLMLC